MDRSVRTGRTVGLLCCVAVLLIAGCQSSPAATPSTGPIPLATVLPLTGFQAALAANYLAGIKAYISYTNDNGGIKGRQINYITQDDGFDVARTVSGVRQVIEQDHVVGIVGGYSTPNALAVDPLVNSLKVPYVAPTAFSNLLYEPVTPYEFTVFPGYKTMFAALTNYAIKTLGKTKLGILGLSTEGGVEGQAGVQETAAVDGATVVATAIAGSNTTDFTGLAQQLEAGSPDAVLCFGSSIQMPLIIKALHQANFNGVIIGNQGGADPAFVKLAGADLANGVYGAGIVDITGTAPGWPAYLAAMQKYAPQVDPNQSVTLVGYIGAYVVVQALKTISGDITGPTLRAALESLKNVDMGGLISPVSFSPTNHLGATYLAITQVQNGKVVPVTKQLLTASA